MRLDEKWEYFCDVWTGAVQSSLSSSDKCSKLFTRPCRGLLIRLFTQMKHCKPISTSSPFSGKRVQTSSTLSFHSLRSLLSPFYYTHEVESRTFPFYSICKEVVPPRQPFSWILLLRERNSHVDASLSASSSSQGSITIYPPYLHNYYFLLPPFTCISQTSFNNPLPQVALETCSGEL